MSLNFVTCIPSFQSIGRGCNCHFNKENKTSTRRAMLLYVCCWIAVRSFPSYPWLCYSHTTLLPAHSLYSHMCVTLRRNADRDHTIFKLNTTQTFSLIHTPTQPSRTCLGKPLNTYTEEDTQRERLIGLTVKTALHPPWLFNIHIFICFYF